jgi:hypothetical protein
MGLSMADMMDEMKAVLWVSMMAQTLVVSKEILMVEQRVVS